MSKVQLLGAEEKQRKAREEAEHRRKLINEGERRLKEPDPQVEEEEAFEHRTFVKSPRDGMKWYVQEQIMQGRTKDTIVARIISEFDRQTTNSIRKQQGLAELKEELASTAD